MPNTILDRKCQAFKKETSSEKSIYFFKLYDRVEIKDMAGKDTKKNGLRAQIVKIYEGEGKFKIELDDGRSAKISGRFLKLREEVDLNVVDASNYFNNLGIRTPNLSLKSSISEIRDSYSSSGDLLPDYLKLLGIDAPMRSSVKSNISGKLFETTEIIANDLGTKHRDRSDRKLDPKPPEALAPTGKKENSSELIGSKLMKECEVRCEEQQESSEGARILKAGNADQACRGVEEKLVSSIPENAGEGQEGEPENWYAVSESYESEYKEESLPEDTPGESIALHCSPDDSFPDYTPGGAAGLVETHDQDSLPEDKDTPGWSDISEKSEDEDSLAEDTPGGPVLASATSSELGTLRDDGEESEELCNAKHFEAALRGKNTAEIEGEETASEELPTNEIAVTEYITEQAPEFEESSFTGLKTEPSVIKPEEKIVSHSPLTTAEKGEREKVERTLSWDAGKQTINGEIKPEAFSNSEDGEAKPESSVNEEEIDESKAGTYLELKAVRSVKNQKSDPKERESSLKRKSGNISVRCRAYEYDYEDPKEPKCKQVVVTTCASEYPVDGALCATSAVQSCSVKTEKSRQWKPYVPDGVSKPSTKLQDPASNEWTPYVTEETKLSRKNSGSFRRSKKRSSLKRGVKSSPRKDNIVKPVIRKSQRRLPREADVSPRRDYDWKWSSGMNHPANESSVKVGESSKVIEIKPRILPKEEGQLVISTLEKTQEKARGWQPYQSKAQAQRKKSCQNPNVSAEKLSQKKRKEIRRVVQKKTLRESRLGADLKISRERTREESSTVQVNSPVSKWLPYQPSSKESKNKPDKQKKKSRVYKPTVNRTSKQDTFSSSLCCKTDETKVNQVEVGLCKEKGVKAWEPYIISDENCQSKPKEKGKAKSSSLKMRSDRSLETQAAASNWQPYKPKPSKKVNPKPGSLEAVKFWPKNEPLNTRSLKFIKGVESKSSKTLESMLKKNNTIQSTASTWKPYKLNLLEKLKVPTAVNTKVKADFKPRTRPSWHPTECVASKPEVVCAEMKERENWKPYSTPSRRIPNLKKCIVSKAFHKVSPMETEEWKAYKANVEKHKDRAFEIEKQRRKFQREKRKIRENAKKSSQVKRLCRECGQRVYEDFCSFCCQQYSNQPEKNSISSAPSSCVSSVYSEQGNASEDLWKPYKEVRTSVRRGYKKRERRLRKSMRKAIKTYLSTPNIDAYSRQRKVKLSVLDLPGFSPLTPDHVELLASAGTTPDSE